MQFLEGRLIVSPSDLTGFLECEHLTQQELAAARGEIERPERKDPELEVLTRRGLEHEARHMAGSEFRQERRSLFYNHRSRVECVIDPGSEDVVMETDVGLVHGTGEVGLGSEVEI